MPKETPTGTGRTADVRESIVAAMQELDLPSPERMLNRIERMLDSKDRDRVLQQLLDGFRKDSPEEMKRVLKVLAADGAEWTREVDKLLANYKPIK
jgi:hypothetical protein